MGRTLAAVARTRTPHPMLSVLLVVQMSMLAVCPGPVMRCAGSREYLGRSLLSALTQPWPQHGDGGLGMFEGGGLPAIEDFPRAVSLSFLVPFAESHDDLKAIHHIFVHHAHRDDWRIAWTLTES